jgi:hypothetical protein
MYFIRKWRKLKWSCTICTGNQDDRTKKDDIGGARIRQGEKTKMEKILKRHDLIKKTVKQSRKRPGVAQRVQGGLGSQISMIFGS